MNEMAINPRLNCERYFLMRSVCLLAQLVSHGSKVIVQHLAYAFLFLLLNHLAVYGCSREKKGRIDKMEI